MTHEDTLRIVEQHWDREVEAGGGHTRPALALTRELVRDFVAGRLEELPGVEHMDPRHLLEVVEGRDVLCLASGGGQQTAMFGLLGARVTSLDLCEGQLRADRVAAQHHGYEVRTVKGDACDLSGLADASFDLVYQANSMGWIADVRAVYRGVHRVLRPGGLYRVAHNNPAVHSACFEGGLAGWDGVGYRIVDRYKGGPVLRNAAGVENMEEGQFTGDHRHLLRDVFGGLLELGFIIRYVAEDPVHLQEPVRGDPGSWVHLLYFVGLGINVVAEKPARRQERRDNRERGGGFQWNRTSEPTLRRRPSR
jgi:SAM-dependent methyltransferase